MSVCNIYDASGKLVWSLGDYGGVLGDVLQIPANSVQTISYPAFSGRTLWVDETSSDGACRGKGVNTTVAYQSGVPVVMFYENTKARSCYIWVE